MKYLAIFLVFLFLAACMPSSQLTLVPAETLAAQTLAAMPKTNTPLPSPTRKFTPTPPPPQGNPTPTLNLSLPGAYCLPTNTARIQALVTRILDAQTIEVVYNYETFHVRYIGLDAPKIAPPPPQWQAPQAVGLNDSLVNGNEVTLIQDVTDTDADGNLLRYVLTDSAFVNYEIIRQGYARFVAAQPNSACDNSFIAAQVEAQGAVRGMWMPTPLPTYTITPTPTITFTPAPVTPTPTGPCDCQGPRLTCNDFRNQRRAQQCFEFCMKRGFGDIFKLDKNGNGLACDSLQP
jgi:micrococcal nuclease